MGNTDTSPGAASRLDVACDRLEVRVRRRLGAAERAQGGRRLVSVIMTTYRSATFVAEPIRSVLDQTYENLELIVVDDASDDETITVIEAICAEDSRVRVVRSLRNRGTYWAKNLGIMHARGDYIALHDSDDFSDPSRLQKQIDAMEAHPGALVCTTNYVRVDEHGKVVMNRGKRERLGFMCLVFDKAAIIERFGFFDSGRKAADNEFYARLRYALTKPAFVHVGQALYTAPVRAASLSAGSDVSLDAEAQLDPLAHLSPDRRAYVECYTQWHEGHEDLRINFPQRERPFPAPAAFITSEREDGDFVAASIASIPRREKGLAGAVRSLLPQVDRLNVYLNHYENVPAFLDHPNIKVARSQDHGDLRDNGKFFFTDESTPGYRFTVDDDIHYPPDYVAYCVAKLRQYDHGVAIGYHGRVLPPAISSFFNRDDTEVITFSRGLAEDRRVHVLGTGTVAYHTSTLDIGLQDFETVGMADVWFAARAQEQQVALVAVARESSFLRPMSGLDDVSLWNELKHEDDVQTAIAKRYEPWVLPALPQPSAQRFSPRAWNGG